MDILDVLTWHGACGREYGPRHKSMIKIEIASVMCIDGIWLDINYCFLDAMHDCKEWN